MAKKIVRGITDVKTINNQDYDTNNVNDLLSDGQYNYIHRKKGKNEEYHNLTDNIKTISSDNTELLAVTNNNKTTNTATLHPKHDSQKEQLLKSTRNTVTIQHGSNGTAEKTTVDTNPNKVLEHENLISDSEYITLNHQTDDATTHIQTAALKEKLDNLQQTKQDVLVAGNGITIQGQTISASGSSYEILENDEDWTVIEHVVTTGNKTIKTIKTFSFETSGYNIMPISGRLQTELSAFIPLNSKVTSGSLFITNDNNSLFLNNSAPTDGRQQATFTFLTINESGGGGGEPGDVRPE